MKMAGIDVHKKVLMVVVVDKSAPEEKRSRYGDDLLHCRRRTALINEIRGFLLERGITFPAQPIHLRKNLPTVVEDCEQNLTPRLRWLLDRLWQEWKQTEIDIKTVTVEIERIGTEDERCRRLRQIPGFGPLVSTAMVAAIGNGAAFRRGRDFAAWVGVVPRQYSTVGKQKLFGICKRGNIYLRRMLIHGARAVLFRIKYDTAGLGQWVQRLSQRSTQQSSGRHRQQSGPHRLGRIVQRQRVSTSTSVSAA